MEMWHGGEERDPSADFPRGGNILMSPQHPVGGCSYFLGTGCILNFLSSARVGSVTSSLNIPFGFRVIYVFSFSYPHSLTMLRLLSQSLMDYSLPVSYFCSQL